jgi:hypothetical protein
VSLNGLISVFSLGDLAVELGLAELENSVDEVANVLEKLVVVGINKLFPLELGISGLGATGEEVESPDIGVNTGILGIVTENTDSTGLAELAVLVVEVLSGRNLVDLGPVLFRTNLRSREDDA